MADVHDKKTRSYNMSQIKATNTKPELLVRKFLHEQGFRYKLHVKTLPGNAELKELLQDVVPALKAHLGHAEMLQKSMTK